MITSIASICAKTALGAGVGSVTSHVLGSSLKEGALCGAAAALTHVLCKKLIQKIGGDENFTPLDKTTLYIITTALTSKCSQLIAKYLDHNLLFKNSFGISLAAFSIVELIDHLPDLLSEEKESTKPIKNSVTPLETLKEQYVISVKEIDQKTRDRVRELQDDIRKVEKRDSQQKESAAKVLLDGTKAIDAQEKAEVLKKAELTKVTKEAQLAKQIKEQEAAAIKETQQQQAELANQAKKDLENRLKEETAQNLKTVEKAQAERLQTVRQTLGET